ncbi:MAG: efflux RND transporter periplasmic adaptor subunit [Eubacterium sp.]|jgi:HlyD family secretion protein|nr:efflux RND transporter periplasmic adaptor subunit [Eubacterium sp.]NBI85428.1 efflux RND transporter periplasmic adaptor subunit [Lachnospiraceae bacterium]
MFQRKSKTEAVAGHRPKKKTKAWKVIAAVVVLVLIIRFIAGMFLGGPKDLRPMVTTAEAATGDIVSTLDTSGVIASELTHVYASPVDAQVGEIPVALGESVERGDFLLTYDTASLQKNYDIAQLQAMAEDATGNDTLAKSSESARDLAVSASDIQTLKGQIDALNAEIASLQSQATENELATNNNAAASEEVSRLEAEVESLGSQITALESKKEQGGISEREKSELKDLRSSKKDREKSLAAKKKKVRSSAELANNMTNIQAQLSQKNSQLAELQGKLGEAESKNASAEAGILSEAAKANISYSQQASHLTLQQSADNLSRAKAGVTADFDGIVTEIAVSAGTMAAEGTPLITLASAGDMCVETKVSKYNLASIQTGQTATIVFQEKEYTGSVQNISKIAQQGESGSAMVIVKVHIDKPDDSLILGLDAEVKIDLGSALGVLAVPISAVNSDMEGNFVYVVENGIVAKKYVTTGLSSKEEIEIKSGIELGEKVITTVDSTIVEGLEVIEAPAEQSGDAEDAGSPSPDGDTEETDSPSKADHEDAQQDTAE